MRVSKTLIAISFFLAPFLTHAQETDIGEYAPRLTFEGIDEASSPISTSALKGKVVLLDFWATWCGPCISNMPHLDSLQQAFPESLEVIAVTMEKQERVRKFAQKRPYAFQYALDASGKSQEVFPYRKIPHSVLIDQQGKVVAITRPQNITKETIRKVLNRSDIDLPLKKDNTSFNYTEDYFEADVSTVESFMIQPGNPAIPSFTKRFQRGPFVNRRLSLHNTTISGMYREAFKSSRLRMVYEVDESLFDHTKTENKFNVDIIVPTDSSAYLRDILKRKLNKALEIKGKKGTREQEVAVLYKLEGENFPAPPATKKSGYSARGGTFSGTGVSLDDFRSYLENHGILGMPVVNETGIEGIYNLKFEFYGEDNQSFFDALKKLGLGIKKESRNIEVVVLYKE